MANWSIADKRCYYFTNLGGQYLSEPGHPSCASTAALRQHGVASRSSTAGKPRITTSIGFADAKPKHGSLKKIGITYFLFACIVLNTSHRGIAAKHSESI